MSRPPCIWLALLLLATAPSRADDMADLQLARNAYHAGEYALAARRFEDLVTREPPAATTIRTEALQYLGASRLYLGDTERARAAFEQLLILDPRWDVSPVIFPSAIVDEFTRVRLEMADRLDALDAAAQARREAARADHERRRAALADALLPRYLAIADQERSLHLCFVPLGVGQFQNGHDVKGWVFLGAEVALAAANVWTFWAWHWYTSEWADNPNSQRGADAAAFANGYKTASWAILGTLAAVVLLGIVDALIFFEDPPPLWRSLAPEDVPAEHRLPVRDPGEFLPPPDDAAAATFGFDLQLRF